MATIVAGRATADLDDADGGQSVVFLIGMRFNRPWRVRSWLPVFTAMPGMIAALQRDPESGLLASRTMIDGRGLTVLQHWRSVEDLQRFAHDRDAPHLAAWREFNRRVSSGGDVGIWHETMPVHGADTEAIYVNMPVLGLARAHRHRLLPGLGRR